jgi:hypothetical protein
MVTLLALILSPRVDEPGLIMATLGTAEAVGPLAFNEIPEAVTLGAESTPELSGCH